MMLVAPLMPGNAENVWVDLGIMSLKVALVLALDILFARYVVPPARNQPIVAEGEKKHASRAHKLTHPEPSQLMPTIPINPSIPIRSTTTKKGIKKAIFGTVSKNDAGWILKYSLLNCSTRTEQR